MKNSKKPHSAPLVLPPGHRPRVLLLGNGLNRVYGGASWTGLLEEINRTHFTTEQVRSLPFPLQAVLLSDDHVDLSLKSLRQKLTACEMHPWLEEQLKKLLALPFDAILTANFTYELEFAADPEFGAVPYRARRYRRHTKAVSQAEKRFMLSTYYMLPVGDGRTVPLFHVHGEALKPDTVILGHYFYGNLLFRYDDYLTRYAPGQSYRERMDDDGMEVLSWLDYFILGDVYSLGFGFDVSEMDLWWLLCRKKRERAAHGSVLFFEPERSSAETKNALLTTYGVERIPLGARDLRSGDYQGFYERAVDEIVRRMQ